jgi:cytochrome c556
MRRLRAGRYAAAAAFLTMTFTGAALTGSASAAPINASDESTIEYRQNIMKTKGVQAAAIGQVLALMVPEDNLISHFETLLLATRQSKLAFTPKIEGGDSLPVVWEKWDDFSARLTKAENNLVKAIAAGREHGGSAGGLGEDAIEAMNSCKECHDIYRKKK